jgi:hypothetical protein
MVVPGPACDYPGQIGEHALPVGALERCQASGMVWIARSQAWTLIAAQDRQGRRRQAQQE